MALDRQKILNELGSVVTQLQSANCGCMENVFGQKAPNPGYNMGWHGHHSTCGGHQHSCNRVCGSTVTPGYQSGYQPPETHANQQHCRGSCKPPQLYTDTFNYLNHNLVQPCVKEAYDDLKTMTPDNTVINNPAIAKQMGLPNATNFQGNLTNISGQNYANETYTGQGPMPSNPMQVPNTMQGGMGPAILNMMTSNPSEQVKASSPTTNNVLSHSVTNNPIPCLPFSGQNNTGLQNIPQITKNNINTIQSNNTSAQNPYYGQHAQSLRKFSEMFPEVMGQGDLGFNPMAVALQMNPENQKQMAYNNGPSMNNNNNDPIVNTIQQPNMQPIVENSGALPVKDKRVYANQIIPMQQIQKGQMSLPNQNNMPSMYPTNQQMYSAVPMQEVMPGQQKKLEQTLTSQALPSYTSALPSQPVTAYENLDKNPPDAHLTTQPAHNQYVKNQAYPAIINQSFTPTQNVLPSEYNTLGQPIEMVPADIYRSPEPPLPQTLSPQPIPIKTNDSARFSNVKYTESKTSLLGTKTLGKTQSRNHLQRMYNEYKGSQSYTQQNIKPFDMITHSDGKLNVPEKHSNNPQDMVIERKSGDTALNNATKTKVEVVGQIGDVPTTNKPITEKLSPIAEGKKCRNGLQDMVYTSYSLTPAWSFHG